MINPWEVERLEAKWVDDVEIVYYGLAGRKKPRSLKERLRDLLNHGNGKLTANGPHRGGEILWQLNGYKEFSLWVLPTDNPPVPRNLEKTIIERFQSITGKLPFANRQK